MIVFLGLKHAYDLPIWPIPKEVLVQPDKSMRLSDSAHFIIKTIASSGIVKDAVNRYKQLIINGATTDQKCNLSATEIDTVVITLQDENEALGIDTKYDYKLEIDAESKGATIVAESPYGVL